MANGQGLGYIPGKGGDPRNREQSMDPIDPTAPGYGVVEDKARTTFFSTREGQPMVVLQCTSDNCRVVYTKKVMEEHRHDDEAIVRQRITDDVQTNPHTPYKHNCGCTDEGVRFWDPPQSRIHDRETI